MNNTEIKLRMTCLSNEIVDMLHIIITKDKPFEYSQDKLLELCEDYRNLRNILDERTYGNLDANKIFESINIYKQNNSNIELKDYLYNEYKPKNKHQRIFIDECIKVSHTTDEWKLLFD